MLARTFHPQERQWVSWEHEMAPSSVAIHLLEFEGQGCWERDSPYSRRETIVTSGRLLAASNIRCTSASLSMIYAIISVEMLPCARDS